MKVGMRKRIVAMAGIALLLCTGAVARSREEKKKAKEEAKETKKELKENLNSFKDIKGTPEDSVIFYGGFEGMGNDFIFTQVNSDYEPDIQSMKGELYFVSEPVKPGSRYVLEYWCWHYHVTYTTFIGTKPQYHTVDYSQNRSYTAQTSPLVIEVPTEPGLYYFGYYAGESSIERGELVQMAYNPSVEAKDNALRKILRYYKGTAWEPLIKQELAEAEVAAKQAKADRKVEQKKAREDADRELKEERARKREARKEKRNSKSKGKDKKDASKVSDEVEATDEGGNTDEDDE